MIHLFTSAAINYLGKVRALFHSVTQHHPDFVCHFLVAEDHTRSSYVLEVANEPFHHLKYASTLQANKERAWFFSHAIVELATAIKPFFALELLQRRDTEMVIYLDPDIVVFSPLDDVLTTLSRSSIALTPHLLQPEREPQAVLDNELCALRHGAFNLGFLALRNTTQAHRFVSWWRDRASEFCVDDLAGGLFTDQKWIDLAPAFFDDLAILRSPRLNVAPWNLGQRRLSGSFDQGFVVEGAPLGFYHFTGLDSGAHRVMAQRYAPGNCSVEMLVDWYEAYTQRLALPNPPPWSLANYDDGEPITTTERRIYRKRPDLQRAFSDPYKTGDNSYRRWLAVHGVHEHPELVGKAA